MDDSPTLLISTAYLPPISYMALVAQEANIVVERKETFPKQTYRNRAQIVTANGVLPLVVPVERPYGNHTRTENIKVSYTEPWNIRHWRALESAYSASPYFLYYQDGLKEILMRKYDKLIDLNHDLLKYLLKKIKVDCGISYTDDYVPNGISAKDHRNTFTPKRENGLFEISPYDQVFDTKMAFQKDMSILDLLFNLGPDTRRYLLELPRK